MAAPPPLPPPPPSDDVIVEQLARDYADYLTPRTEHDARAMDTSIEELLTKLEEYCGLVDIVRSDTTLCLKRTLPEIQTKSRAMQGVFERVDQLEVFVGMVKAHVATMEALLDQAEAEMSSSSMKKFFSAVPSFFGRKSPAKVERALSKFEPPEVFTTEDYFPKQPQETEDAAEVTEVKDKESKPLTDSNETKVVEKEELAQTEESQEVEKKELSGEKDAGNNENTEAV